MHQRTVTGDAPEGLEADRAAVEQLGPAGCSGQGLEIGHHVDRVAVRTRGVSRGVEVGSSGPGQVHERVHPPAGRGRFR